MKTKHQFLRFISIRLALVACALLAPSVCSAQAQTPSAQPNSSNHNQTNQAVFQFFRYPTPTQSDRPFVFRLRPAHYKLSASALDFSLMPVGAPPPPIVTTLNGMSGDLMLAPGANITITPGTNTLTIATAGLLSSVNHNATLTGGGTTGSPLGIANAGVGANHLADRAVTVPKLNTPTSPTAGQVLSFDGRSMRWQTPAASIASVTHNETLTGDGIAGAPLGLAIPLSLAGTFCSPCSSTMSIKGGFGSGGSLAPSDGGVVSQGGDGVGPLGSGGAGVTAIGGTGIYGNGGGAGDGYGNAGIGLRVLGGEVPAQANNRSGGVGAIISGGKSFGTYNNGGNGAEISGGDVSGASGSGGHGVIAHGGDGKYITPPSGPGLNHAGNGITAIPGQPLDGASPGKAGEFIGAVEISGNLNVTGGTKNFKIDHPLDPANKYLIHAAIESSEVLNVYSGNIVTNECGDAVVRLPDWFEVINADLRYQLTVIGAFAQAIVAEKVKGNRFVIKTDAPNVEVSWQVTGVRSDAAMRKNPFKVEENKPEGERGRYLSPAAFDQPEENGVEWARYPELMKQRKERREVAQKPPQQ